MNNQTAIDVVDELDIALAPEDSIEDIKQKSVSGAATYFLRTILLQGIGLVSAAIISNFLSPSEFGLFGVVLHIIGFLVFFSDIGLAAALIQQKRSPTRSEYKAAFTVQQILAWVIFAICLSIVLTGSFSAQLNQTGYWILISLAISFPLASLKTVPSVILERKLDFSKLVVPHIFEQLTYNIVLIVLVIAKFGVISYAYAVIARSVIGVIAMYWIQPWKIGFGLKKSALKNLFSFGVKFQLNDFLARIKDNLFFIFMSSIMPQNAFGFLQWSKTWSMYPYNLTVQNIIAITFPTFSRMQGHKKELGKAVDSALFFIMATILPIVLGMSIFIIPLTRLIPGYVKWQPAVALFIMFTLSVIWAAISSPLTNTLNAIGEINSTLKLMVFWTVITWVLIPLGWKFGGLNGVGIATLLIASTSVLPIWIVKKHIKIHVWEQVWRQLAAGVLMVMVGAAGMYWWKSSFSLMLVGMVLTGMAYLLGFAGIGFGKIKAEIKSLRRKS